MTPTKVGKQIRIVSYYSPKTVDDLKALSDKSRVPQAAYLREALDDLLRKDLWRRELPGCFGLNDVKLAIHALDSARAKALIKTAKALGASFEEFQQQIVWHCYKEWTAPGLQEHIAAQVKTARKLWGKDSQA